MDIATLIGILLGLACTLISILLGGSLMAFFDVASVFVVLGGGMASVLISYRLKEVIRIFKVVGNAFKTDKTTPLEVIRTLIEIAEKTRKEGLLSIEANLEGFKDNFMKSSLQLVIDGIESEMVREYMDLEIDAMKARHGKGISLFKTMGALFPAWGMIGTLIGLINLLKSLDDPSKIGPAMAVALITTFYGSVLANFVCIPIANKLKLKSEEEVQLKMMIVEGVMSIQAGENPKMIESKLRVFLSPEARLEALKRNLDPEQ
jgi:chemotaxis protein MotA